MFFVIEDNFKWPWFHYLLTEPESKQSLQKTKASEMKTIQEEVDDMEIQNCQDTDQDYYTQGTILHAPTNDSHQSLAPESLFDTGIFFML
jgi:catalase